MNIAILGSTGSIGKSSLKVVSSLAGKFNILALSTNSNTRLLAQQIRNFHPDYVCVSDKNSGILLEKKFKNRVKVFLGEESLPQLVKDRRIERIVIAISGSAALNPLLAAIDAGKDIALANKEALVMAGDLIMLRAKEKAKIIPVDSEQSAIWQCLQGEDPGKIKNIYLTASGGPFRQTSLSALKNVSVARVLKHPRWKMGKKISVDSASLMNKGLELIEAMHLFGVGPEKIKVVIHPQAIIHSMVEFIDGVVLAQLSETDMRIPIQYALTYPKRMNSTLKQLDFFKLKELNFSSPDLRKFPCLALCYAAARDGGTAPCVLNAANEICVEEFLRRRLDFIRIPTVVEKVLSRHKTFRVPSLKDIWQADNWARQEARKIIIN